MTVSAGWTWVSGATVGIVAALRQKQKEQVWQLMLLQPVGDLDLECDGPVKPRPPLLIGASSKLLRVLNWLLIDIILQSTEEEGKTLFKKKKKKRETIVS